MRLQRRDSVDKKGKHFFEKYDLFLLLYVNDGAGHFSSLSDAIMGSNIIFHTRLSLNIHINRNNKISKTEAVFSLPEKL